MGEARVEKAPRVSRERSQRVGTDRGRVENVCHPELGFAVTTLLLVFF